MGLRLTVAPTAEAVTRAEVKAFLKVEHTDDDDLIDALITAARELVETETNRQIMPATYELTLDRFPDSSYAAIELPRPPLQSVTSITYVDTAGNTQTWSSADYQVDAKGIVGRIKPAYSEVYPSTRDQMNAVTITFVAGFETDGLSPADLTPDVPKTILLAIKHLAGHWYNQRDIAIVGATVSDLPYALRALIWANKVPTVA